MNYKVNCINPNSQKWEQPKWLSTYEWTYKMSLSPLNGIYLEIKEWSMNTRTTWTKLKNITLCERSQL